MFSGVTRGKRTAPGDTLQGGHPNKKIVGKLTKNSGQRGRTGKKGAG